MECGRCGFSRRLKTDVSPLTFAHMRLERVAVGVPTELRTRAGSERERILRVPQFLTGASSSRTLRAGVAVARANDD